MIYYGRYKLANGKWQQWAIFNSKKEALETLQFHAQGREIELLSETEYKNKKRRTKQMTTKKSQQKTKNSQQKTKNSVPEVLDSGPNWLVIRYSDITAHNILSPEFYFKKSKKRLKENKKEKENKTLTPNN